MKYTTKGVSENLKKQKLTTLVALTENEKRLLIQKYLPKPYVQTNFTNPNTVPRNTPPQYPPENHIPQNFSRSVNYSHNAEDDDFWSEYNYQNNSNHTFSQTSYPRQQLPQSNYSFNGTVPQAPAYRPSVTNAPATHSSMKPPAIAIVLVFLLVAVGLGMFAVLNPFQKTNVDTHNATDVSSVPTQPTQSTQSDPYGVIKSGTVGDITFTFYGTGALYLKGSGEIPKDFARTEGLTEIVRSVFINNGISAIGDSAFKECSHMTNITIPDSVTRIGDSAISYCNSLVRLVIPENVTEIGNLAFYWCQNLTSIEVSANNIAYSSLNGVLFNKDKTELICCPTGKNSSYTIPQTVEKIDNLAFYNCNITRLSFSRNVKKIGYGAFLNCKKMTAINVSTENNTYSSLDGVLFDKNKTKILACPTGKSGKLTIPDGVTAIEKACFEWCTLSAVTMPDSITSIGDYAFEGSALTEITIPDKVTTIGTSAFESCSALKKAFIPDSITAIPDNAFQNCPNLIMYGSKGSYAETFAEKNNIIFASK